jgi:hypothetical protein
LTDGAKARTMVVTERLPSLRVAFSDEREEAKCLSSSGALFRKVVRLVVPSLVSMRTLRRSRLT